MAYGQNQIEPDMRSADAALVFACNGHATHKGLIMVLMAFCLCAVIVGAALLIGSAKQI